jgi:hypothetical protein
MHQVLTNVGCRSAEPRLMYYLVCFVQSHATLYFCHCSRVDIDLPIDVHRGI